MPVQVEAQTSSQTSRSDPFLAPPIVLREGFKRYRKAKLEDIRDDPRVIDLTEQGKSEGVTAIFEPEAPIVSSGGAVIQSAPDRGCNTGDQPRSRSTTAYEVDTLPGLQVFPSLLSPAVQIQLLDHLLHRDLSTPVHQSNVHFHHDIAYPPGGRSFFSLDPGSVCCTPKARTTHEPLTVQQFLARKLRWFTLGGQYDWTRKIYPDEPPPKFPRDIKEVLQGYVPAVEPEAAIVNIYSTGDTLSLHRDVAEHCSQPLVSVSLGCDALFMVGGCPTPSESCVSNMDENYVVLHLRSGDLVVMSGDSRYAFHGVPKIFGGTCPDYLRAWPSIASGDEAGSALPFGAFRGWLAEKRVNLNVRQMYQGEGS